MRFLFITIITLLSFHVSAQDNKHIFKGELYNEEYQIYIKMDFYDNNIIPSNQPIFGELPGYFGANRDARLWLFTDVTLTNENTAHIQIINDFGSEDLNASLTYRPDGTYILKQLNGSSLKIVVNKKWLKLPKTITFKRK